LVVSQFVLLPLLLFLAKRSMPDIVLQSNRPLTTPCTIVAVAKNIFEHSDAEPEEEDFECELDPADAGGYSGITVIIDIPGAEKANLRSKLRSGELVSGESTVQNAAKIYQDGTILTPNGNVVVLGGPHNKEGKNRRLAIGKMQNTQRVLVVKVFDVNGLARSETPAQISDDIFGTIQDPVNLRSQILACSHGALDLAPANDLGVHEAANAPGVIEVTIDISLLINTRTAIKNEVTTAVTNKLGKSPGTYFYAMYVLEKCYTDCGWAAYATVNHWSSVYQLHYYKYAAVQVQYLVCSLTHIVFANECVGCSPLTLRARSENTSLLQAHELGHNFNLAHSGMGEAEYTDHTCLVSEQ